MGQQREGSFKLMAKTSQNRKDGAAQLKSCTQQVGPPLLLLLLLSCFDRRKSQIKALCLKPLKDTYLFNFKDSSAFLSFLSELCFQYYALLKCDVLWSVRKLFQQSQGKTIYLSNTESLQNEILYQC